MRVTGDPPASQRPPGPPKSLFVGPTDLSAPQLVMIFVRTGSLAFGGGGSTLAMLHSEFCVQRRNALG